MSRKVDKPFALIVQDDGSSFVTVAEFDDLYEAMAALSSSDLTDSIYEIVCNHCGCWRRYRKKGKYITQISSHGPV